mgnify:CR=1 FL=1
MRKFEVISINQFNKDFKDADTKYDDIIIPKRSTKFSAGYDFYMPYDLTIKKDEVVLIPTGIKAMLNSDEFLGIYIRSSLGFKYNLRMCNQVGIIDSDYYDNTSNEGHIFVKLKNEGDNDIILKKYDRYVQCIIQKYYIVDNEKEVEDIRVGGIGSSGRRDK